MSGTPSTPLFSSTPWSSPWPSGLPIGSLPLLAGSLALPAPLPTHPPVIPPRGAAADRPALRVLILGGIIHIKKIMVTLGRKE
ncbi:hypothetical protein Tco_0928849, partial [Tanacetum coccineum]